MTAWTHSTHAVVQEGAEVGDLSMSAGRKGPWYAYPKHDRGAGLLLEDVELLRFAYPRGSDPLTHGTEFDAPFTPYRKVEEKVLT